MLMCRDCEQETKKLNKDGICKACATRKANAKYVNKEYIPLKDIKGTREYKQAMSRRNTPAKSHRATETKDKEDNIVNNIKSSYYMKVSKDINKAFKEAGLDEDYIKNRNLDVWLETFYTLTRTENFITDAKKAESVFNNLYNLYRHSQENLDWNDIEKIQEISCIQKALLELRRPTKNMLDLYEVIDPLIVYLQQDDKFMKLLEDSRILMIKKVEAQADPKYHTNIESNLIDNSFVEPSIIEKKNKLYDCTVWCYNLNGDPNRRLFRANNGISAKSEVEARLKFKRFLADKFSTVTYKDKDINIKEVNNVDEINYLANKKEFL